MGVCLSKAGLPHHPHQHHQSHGGFLSNDDDGFCTPECVSSQYESPNPSGRHSFAHLDTPRVSADVGDFGVLGSLFYKRGSRSREMMNTIGGGGGGNGSYISPLDMFLGGVSGRRRVHHVNQICAGDYSFASYLVSPLLKGFDVHAMEAVAKSYAESAAKAAARDTFVFLEENDVSVASFQGGRGAAVGAATARKAPSSATATAAAEDEQDEDGDADDDLAKSGESEDWEEPRKAENWAAAPAQPDGKSEFKVAPHFRASGERGTSDRWVSVLNAVQARAKARRRQKRKSAGDSSLKERSSGGGSSLSRKKTVRFQLDGVQAGFADDDDDDGGIRSGKEAERDPAPETAHSARAEGNSAGYGDEEEEDDDDGEVGIQEKKTVECSEVLGNSEGGSRPRLPGNSGAETALSEEEIDYYLWQEEEEAEERGKGANGGDGHDIGNGFYREKIVDTAEFAGFTAAEVVDGLRATASEVFDGLRASSSAEASAGQPSSSRAASANGGGDGSAGADHLHVHVHHPSLESFSSGEYFLPEVSFGEASREDSSSVDVQSLPNGRAGAGARGGGENSEDDEEGATSAARIGLEDSAALQSQLEGEYGGEGAEEDEDRNDEEEDGDDYGEDGEIDTDVDEPEDEDEDEDERQCCLTDYATCEESEAAAAAAVATSVSHSSQLEVDSASSSSSSSFTKDIPVNDEEAKPAAAMARPSLPAIPVGCVVVESRLADGSRLNPQILDPGEVPLPERGEKNCGFFHARVLCSGESSPADDPSSDHEGGFSFPVLLPAAAAATPASSAAEKRITPLAPPLATLDAPIKNRTVMVHSVLANPTSTLLPPPRSVLTNPVREIHEVVANSPKLLAFPSDGGNHHHHHSSSSFSFDVEPVADAKKVHEIILPSPPVAPSRSAAASPVFTPSSSSSKAPVSPPPPLLPVVPLSALPYPQRARRTFNKKLKFYSLERASFAAAGGAKRSSSPPNFAGKVVRERRRDAPEGESDSDLFEIETMSGTNAMGSSRTPPPTPTMGGGAAGKAPPAAASFDFDKLSDSIARVGRSRSKRGGGGGGLPPVPQWPPSRNSKAGGRCLPVERRRDRVFEDRSGLFSAKGSGGGLQSSLKGRALLKLGLLMRTAKRPPPPPPPLQDVPGGNHDADSEPNEFGEACAPECSENDPPSPTADAAAAPVVGNTTTTAPAVRYVPLLQRLSSDGDIDKPAAAAPNYAFDWYNCSSLDPRNVPLSHEKRQQQQRPQPHYNPFASHNRPFSAEDRTFALKS